MFSSLGHSHGLSEDKSVSAFIMSIIVNENFLMLITLCAEFLRRHINWCEITNVWYSLEKPIPECFTTLTHQWCQIIIDSDI